MNHSYYLNYAAAISLKSRVETPYTARQYFLAAVGFSRSGVLRNAVNRTSPGVQRTPQGHAERVLLRKAKGVKIVYVARTQPSGDWAMAKPCELCEAALRAAGVTKVIYTISPNEYGVLKLI